MGSLGSTTGSYRAGTAVPLGEVLAGLYSEVLGFASQHLLFPLTALGNTHCLFLLVIGAPASSSALSMCLLCFQQLVGKVRGGTSLSLWACFTCTFGCPIPLFSLPIHFMGEWLRAGFTTSSSAALLGTLRDHCLQDCCATAGVFCPSGNATLTCLSDGGSWK